MCTSYLAGATLSCPIGMAGVYPVGRGIFFYFEEPASIPTTHTEALVLQFKHGGRLDWLPLGQPALGAICFYHTELV